MKGSCEQEKTIKGWKGQLHSRSFKLDSRWFCIKTETQAKCLNPWKNIIFIISINDVVFVFGKRQQNGWKARLSEYFNECDYKALHELYEVVCAHTSTKKNSCSILMRVVGSS